MPHNLVASNRFNLVQLSNRQQVLQFTLINQALSQYSVRGYCMHRAHLLAELKGEEESGSFASLTEPEQTASTYIRFC